MCEAVPSLRQQQTLTALESTVGEHTEKGERSRCVYSTLCSKNCAVSLTNNRRSQRLSLLSKKTNNRRSQRLSLLSKKKTVRTEVIV
jgi:hypothetical protein